MASSGIRLGAWDFLKWEHIMPISGEGKVIAAKITVYAGDQEKYISFLTPEAFLELQKWMNEVDEEHDVSGPFFEEQLQEYLTIALIPDYKTSDAVSQEFRTNFVQDKDRLIPNDAEPVKMFLERLQTLTDAATSKTKNDIKPELEKVEGFLEVQYKKKEIATQLTEALAEDEDMRVIVAKCEELMRPGVLPGVRQVNDGNADED
ncbi:MAG: hypothetical protein ACRD8W_21875 [Nitrososphaeraceae archaeon]